MNSKEKKKIVNKVICALLLCFVVFPHPLLWLCFALLALLFTYFSTHSCAQRKKRCAFGQGWCVVAAIEIIFREKGKAEGSMGKDKKQQQSMQTTHNHTSTSPTIGMSSSHLTCGGRDGEGVGEQGSFSMGREAPCHRVGLPDFIIPDLKKVVYGFLFTH